MSLFYHYLQAQVRVCRMNLFFFKMFHLATPYFWDELGVYTRAAFYMYDHGLTLLPGVIPADLSRGHPLLCAAVFGFMYTILGPHVWVGHLTALLMSCALLVLVYKVGRTLTQHHVAGLACLMLMVQPVFIAQATMVLPEVMLSLLCTAAIFAYAKKRLGFFALFATLAIFTKETAIALPAAIGCLELGRIGVARRFSKESFLLGFSPSGRGLGAKPGVAWLGEGGGFSRVPTLLQYDF